MMQLQSQRITSIVASVRPQAPGVTRLALRHPRFFNSRPPLRTVGRPQSRPQIPFLTRTSKRGNSPRATRLLSTEQKESIKYQIKLALYWSVIGWTLFGGAAVLFAYFKEDWLDRLYPAPADWYFLTKWFWRQARHEEATEGEGRGIINWGKVATRYRSTVLSVEDYHFFIRRPSGVQEQEDWDRSIPGIDEAELRQPPPTVWRNRIGYDISMKSEDWRRGYYEAMMGMSKAAEMQTGWWMDKETRLNYPAQHVRSPSNPTPKPLPPGAPYRIPDIEDCEPAFESADFHYQRLLTTKGFTREQYMRAGIAYALWKDYEGKPDVAEKLYRWSLDLAGQGVPNADAIFSSKTAILRADAPLITSNILEATTALANHYARHERTSEALSIYLSVLRARKAAPNAPALRKYKPKGPDYSLSSADSMISYLVSVPFSPKYPDPAPSGDLPFERTASSNCEEAALMAYVGEVLFAKNAKSRLEGLVWTQDAAALAEEGMSDKKLDATSNKVCTQCFDTALGNWANMVSAFAREQEERKSKGAVSKSAGAFWTTTSNDNALEGNDWVEEEKRVRKRLEDYQEEKLNKRLTAMIRGQSKMFVV